MYAVVADGGSHVGEARERLNRVVREQLIPAYRQEPGFRGALNLVDEASGHRLMITLWETEADARAERTGPAVREAHAAVRAIMAGGAPRVPPTVYAVNAQV
jgi:quinol monooxygenase YgiN